MAPLRRHRRRRRSPLLAALPWTDMRMTVRLTVVGFAALMLVPSLADAQGLTWHYEPDSLVGMPDVTFAPTATSRPAIRSTELAARNHDAGAASRSP